MWVCVCLGMAVLIQRTNYEPPNLSNMLEVIEEKKIQFRGKLYWCGQQEVFRWIAKLQTLKSNLPVVHAH